MGNLENKTQTTLLLSTDLNSKQALEGLLISIKDGAKIYLRDLAEISSGPIDIKSYYAYSDKQSSKGTVLL